MKTIIDKSKFLVTLFLSLYSLAVTAQDKTANELKSLLDNDQFDKIISQYTSDYKEYSAKSLYYIGQAYYMKEDDANCLKFLDLSINKDDKDPSPIYIKASTLNYMGKYDEAVKWFKKAISLKADDAEFYSGLGDSYYQITDYNAALDSYKKATEQNACPNRPYLMIGQIYSAQKQNDKALEAFYTAKSKISKESPSYLSALFNIGLFESLLGNYEKAEPAFTELIQIDPADYHSYAKLIQVYYHKKEYEKAKPYKDKLHEAYAKGVIKDNVKDMFCFDQFKWNGYSVQVFERYENKNTGNIYNKHIFYFFDDSDKLVLRVQTEFSPISVELGGPKYLLCATKTGARYNPGIGFNDDLNYDDLKTQALKVFDKYK